ncbi:MAG TPA: SLC13 family permease [Caulobacteraceae bacterium]|jgi:anion transporter|nr:SLC13 family permease [Caulobacteraceae bacterium]
MTTDAITAAGETPPPPNPLAPALRHWPAAAQLLTLAIPLVIWFLPLGLPREVQGTFAILAFLLIAWITESVDYAVAGLAGCFLFWVLGLAKIGVAFGGFVDSTAWFMFAALLMGQIATKTTVAKRLANQVMLRVGTTYPRVLLGLIITDFLLTFIVPSGTARLVVMATIALGLVESFGVKKGSNIGRGMFLILTYTSVFFDKFVIAGATSITGRGLIEKFGGVSISWSQWFVAFLPLALATILVCWRLTLWLFPPETVELEGGKDYVRARAAEIGPWRPIDLRAAALLAGALVMWLTDSLHHIQPAMVALGVALIALLPRVDVLDVEDVKKTNLLPFFFVAAAISMGAVLSDTGALKILTDFLFQWMEPFMSNGFVATAVLYWSAFVYHFFLASEIAMMTTSVPPLMAFAKDHGYSPGVLGMIWVFAAGGKLFAYQSAVTIIGYSYGFFKAVDLLKLGALLTLIEFVLLLGAVAFYWPLIGIR